MKKKRRFLHMSEKTKAQISYAVTVFAMSIRARYKIL